MGTIKKSGKGVDDFKRIKARLRTMSVLSYAQRSYMRTLTIAFHFDAPIAVVVTVLSSTPCSGHHCRCAHGCGIFEGFVVGSLHFGLPRRCLCGLSFQTSSNSRSGSGNRRESKRFFVE